MERTVERALVAKVGAIVFAGALGSPLALTGATAQASVTFTAASERLAVAAVPYVFTGVPTVLADMLDVPTLPSATVVLGTETAAVASVGVVTTVAPEWPAPEPLVTDGIVVASWYGPGFYGNKTACGQLYTPEIVGVAHRTLPCGTLITITSPKGITLTVPVIDRGPFIKGRSLDLSNATRAGLQCSDLCHVRMVVRP